MDDFSWIIQFPHTHQSSKDLFVCDVFVDFDKVVTRSADDEIVYGEYRGDRVCVTVQSVHTLSSLDVPDLDGLIP